MLHFLRVAEPAGVMQLLCLLLFTAFISLCCESAVAQTSPTPSPYLLSEAPIGESAYAKRRRAPVVIPSASLSKARVTPQPVQKTPSKIILPPATRNTAYGAPKNGTPKKNSMRALPPLPLMETPLVTSAISPSRAGRGGVRTQATSINQLRARPLSGYGSTVTTESAGTKVEALPSFEEAPVLTSREVEQLPVAAPSTSASLSDEQSQANLPFSPPEAAAQPINPTPAGSLPVLADNAPDSSVIPMVETKVEAPVAQPQVATATESVPPSEPASVNELPVASSGGNKAEVAFFTPDPNTPSATTSTAQAEPEHLSEETKNILYSLPPDALPRPVNTKADNAAGNDFSIKHAIETAPFAKSSSDQIPSERGESTMKINVKPESVDLNYELEKAYDALIAGNTDGAIRIYEEVLTIDPNDKTALFGLATTYHRIGLLDQARPVYGRLLKIDPYNVEALNNFFALVGTEAPRAAIEQLELLSTDNPDFAPIQAQLSLLYQRLNDPQKAIEHMAKAATISPENLAYKYNLAVLYDTNGDGARASSLYRYLLNLRKEGQELPASAKAIQERLTFLSSNRPT